MKPINTGRHLSFTRSLTLALLLGPSPTFAAGDIAAGEKVFGRCAPCHATERGANKIGPSLAGVVGRKAGTAPGFKYSPALANAPTTWDEGSLDKFLQNPTGFVHGTQMFTNVANGEDRQNVIAYLESLPR
ncbi:MAG: cytochrome c [Candidatus Binatota bacterium]|nr:cytochrome c [Candidatus Binatota bacterium]